MNLKNFCTRRTRNTISTLSRFNRRSQSSCFHRLKSYCASSNQFYSFPNILRSSALQNPLPQSPKFRVRYVHVDSAPLYNQPLCLTSAPSHESIAGDEEDQTMTEFFSRFVSIMREKLSEAYPECDKSTVDGMLLIIVQEVVAEMDKGLENMRGSFTGAIGSQDLSEDLWKTVWEVSFMVLEDMKRLKKKEKIKEFLQNEDVKEMYRFASEIGIRGDMLRELRFKWAREKMEEGEFYEGLERIRSEAQREEQGEMGSEEDGGEGDKSRVMRLLKRTGKLRYKIYGLDLSDPKWTELADKIHEAGEVMWPKEPKEVSGKAKLIMEKILALNGMDDPSELLGEWKELLQPTRIDWIALLDRINQCSTELYCKVAELVLKEESFDRSVHDYTKLIDVYAKANRVEDAERILKKMTEDGVSPDLLTFTILVQMYSKAGILERAEEAFERLRSHGFQPGFAIYNSMFFACINTGNPKMGEALVKEMEARDIKPIEEIYMALLRSYSERGQIDGAHRIATTMQFAGFKLNLESFTLLIDAWARAGYPEQARNNFDNMIKLGHKPTDRCIASVISAYEKKNLLDKALDLLLQLEKDGFQPGIATSTVLLDWFSILQLVDEAEQILGKIAGLGEAPPYKVHVSLCNMYSRAGIEKKAFQALEALEAKKEELNYEEFERIIEGLIEGGFVQEARRMQGVMETQGFASSEKLKVALMASQAFRPKRFTLK